MRTMPAKQQNAASLMRFLSSFLQITRLSARDLFHKSNVKESPNCYGDPEPYGFPNTTFQTPVESLLTGDAFPTMQIQLLPG